jgi:hypothetical protein
MAELALKLAANVFILMIALITWGLEHRWQDRRAGARRRATHGLFAAICAGSIVGAVVTSRSHSEDRQQHERIARIDHGVVELVELARERDPMLTELEALENISSEVRALRGLTSNLERELGGLKRYGNVAMLNGFGLSGKIGPGSGLKETSALSLALERAYIPREVEGKAKRFPRCDEEGTAAFLDAMKINPDYPFSHWGLAFCAEKAGDREWRRYAERAVTILEHTTRIAGHHPHHDVVLKELSEMLGQQ